MILMRFKAAAVANVPELASPILHCQSVHGNLFTSVKFRFAYGSIRSQLTKRE
jgi:hypothetical protein